MEVICLHEPAFYKLVDEVLAYARSQNSSEQNEWISGAEAMTMLHIKSKTTLQTLRDTGKIRYSQPQKRIIVYSRTSINEYLELNAEETF